MDQSFSIALPLKKKVRLDPGDLLTELRLLVEQTGATVRMDPRMIHQPAPARSGFLPSFRASPPEVIAFELDGVRLRVSLHAEPFESRSEIGKYVNPVKWDHGLGEFTDHRAYFRIHEAGIEGEEGPDAVFDRAASVTATAYVVARLTDPVGAIWIAARNSLPMRAFNEAVAELQAGRAPLSFWLRWHVIPPGEMEDLNSGIVTGGLAPFTGREIMARPSSAETREMIEHALTLARRMVDEKLAVSDGQTVEGHAGAALTVRLGARTRKGDAPVCEIALVDAPAARPVVAAPPRREDIDPLGLGTGLGLPGMPLPNPADPALGTTPTGIGSSGDAARLGERPAGDPPRGQAEGQAQGQGRRVIRLVPGGRGSG